MTSLFRSDNAKRSTRGAPSVIPAQTTGSSIQAAIETTRSDEPCTLKNWPVARCSTRRTLTLRPK
ncbi:hypothetical protein REMIM1_PC00168 (plasmid) [Rhizobium etli bv. mimosae str. Mim1]|nr:hypothetical protein REMIM1_PC00161 [Rhizobium etli bv. mimosae str. Mim1]AGS24521.1 hypothetical protein REMIM1_PC00168 [Rhizobium etli bv. mimosae str. Mim1]